MSEIKDELEKYSLQIAGALWLFCAWIFWLIHNPYYRFGCLGLLIAVLIIDIICIAIGGESVSQWIQRQLKPKYDLIVMIGMFIISAYIVCQWQTPIHPHDVLLFGAICIIKGHLFWHGD